MTIRRIALLFLTLLPPFICFADSAASNTMANANGLYLKKDYRQAQAAYLKLINEGYISMPLYFNAGNASYKTGDIASALLYYEKARRLSPGDEAINFNIRLANSKTVDRADMPPDFFLARWWHSVILSFSSVALAIAGILFFLIASASLILYFFAARSAIKKYSFFTSIIIFVLGILAVFTAYSQSRYFNRHKEAIIFEQTVNVRNTPVLRSATVFELHNGTKVTIVKTENGWFKIQSVNGHEGWLQAASVRSI